MTNRFHTEKRIDIQYLRGISVAAVLLFHGLPNAIPNGYLGVDIFFVISGFVMTPKIMQIWSNKDKKTRTKNLILFYQSRIIRLAPAFTFTVTIFGALLFLFGPFSEVRHYSAQSLAASVGLANFEALNQSQNDYFRPNPNAFLHTWSLSAEVQIYLVAPLLLLAINTRTRKAWMIICFSALCLMTQLSLETLTNYDGQIFYSPLSRIWEFGLGAAVSLMKTRKIPILKSNLLLIFTVVLILLPTRITLGNLLISVTTAHMLFYGIDQLTGYMNKFFVELGNISYSVYLIHLPILHLSQHILFDQYYLSLVIYFLFTLICGYFVSTTIEFRVSRKLRILRTRSRILSLGCILIAPVLLSLIFRVLSVNFAFVTDAPEIQGTNVCTNTGQYGECGFKDIKKDSILLIGDSHANALSKTFTIISNQLSLQPVITSGRGCKLNDLNSYPLGSPCSEYILNVNRLANKSAIKIIVISQRGSATETEIKEDRAASDYVKAAEKLKKPWNRILLLGPNPETKLNRAHGTFLDIFKPTIWKDLSEFRNHKEDDKFISEYAKIATLDFLSISDVFCDRKQCLIKKFGRYLYWDENHLSLEGARHLQNTLKEKISTLL
jgi:peptidoglycan/LPS O-acetylase OafA/YrhL